MLPNIDKLGEYLMKKACKGQCKDFGELCFSCNFPPLRKTWNCLAYSGRIESFHIVYNTGQQKNIFFKKSRFLQLI